MDSPVDCPTLMASMLGWPVGSLATYAPVARAINRLSVTSYPTAPQQPSRTGPRLWLSRAGDSVPFLGGGVPPLPGFPPSVPSGGLQGPTRLSRLLIGRPGRGRTVGRTSSYGDAPPVHPLFVPRRQDVDRGLAGGPPPVLRAGSRHRLQSQKHETARVPSQETGQFGRLADPAQCSAVHPVVGPPRQLDPLLEREP
jgi:hypothetical protein